MITTRKTEK